MKDLSERQIFEDNPHFGKQLRLVESAPHVSRYGDWTWRKTVGSADANLDGHTVDAWATYLWSPSQQRWYLGAN